jgi:hypothetical protein
MLFLPDELSLSTHPFARRMEAKLHRREPASPKK